MTIKIMIVDDQMLLREGIKSLLSLSDAVDVVAEAGDGEEALTLLQSQAVDVVLMDIRMPKMNGIEAVSAMGNADISVPVIMLTTFDDHQMVLEAISAGAKGYLLKDVSLDTLLDAIATVHRGETLIQPAITERVLDGLRGKQTDFNSYEVPEPLTEKETEILRLMAAGCSNREISQAMFKSEGTVKNQVSNVLAKLGVRDRTRAVLKAIELGVI